MRIGVHMRLWRQGLGKDGGKGFFGTWICGTLACSLFWMPSAQLQAFIA